MTIGELFSGIDPGLNISEALAGIEVLGVTSDSREVENGFLFVCIKGNSFDGHSAASEMLKNGACAAVTQEKLGLDHEINVENSRKIYPVLLSAFYGGPTRKFKLGAVTGTNGKTTAVNLCAHITRSLGHKTGVIGTLGTDTGEGLVYSHNGPPTTPEPRRMYGLFKEMADGEAEFCFIEASSQALAQHRFAAERFAAAAFTNLTRDHLDYHGTMENYFEAKKSLFDMCENAVINIDDEYGAKIAAYCREKGINTVTVSLKSEEADYFAEFVKLSADRSEFILTDRAAEKSYPVRFAMTGMYNVLNALTAAVMVKLTGGFPLDEIVCALERVSGVSGRLETLYSGEFTVIRDYAHTGDALEKLLSTLRPLPKGRIICVFGAAGDRDKGKRPAMGKTAAKYSDYLIVTTDNPAFEDPQATIDGVCKGIPKGTPYECFTDREEAIIRALELAKSGDLVVLCGKGHEDYQIIKGEYRHFDEKEIVENYFK